MHISAYPKRQLLYALVITLISAMAFAVFTPVMRPSSGSAGTAMGLIGQVFAMVMAFQCLRVREWKVKSEWKVKIQAYLLLVFQTMILGSSLLPFVRH